MAPAGPTKDLGRKAPIWIICSNWAMPFAIWPGTHYMAIRRAGSLARRNNNDLYASLL